MVLQRIANPPGRICPVEVRVLYSPLIIRRSAAKPDTLLKLPRHVRDFYWVQPRFEHDSFNLAPINTVDGLHNLLYGVH